jgi:hypothetical protein
MHNCGIVECRRCVRSLYGQTNVTRQCSMCAAAPRQRCRSIVIAVIVLRIACTIFKLLILAAYTILKIVTFVRRISLGQFGHFHQLLTLLPPFLLLLNPLHPAVDQRGNSSDRFEYGWRHGGSRNIHGSRSWYLHGRSGSPSFPSKRVQSLGTKLQKKA